MSILNAGMAAVAASLAAMLAACALLDAWFAFRGELALGARINRWAGRYPLYAALVIAFLGMLLAHFFLHEGIA